MKLESGEYQESWQLVLLTYKILWPPLECHERSKSLGAQCMRSWRARWGLCRCPSACHHTSTLCLFLWWDPVEHMSESKTLGTLHILALKSLWALKSCLDWQQTDKKLWPSKHCNAYAIQWLIFVGCVEMGWMPNKNARVQSIKQGNRSGACFCPSMPVVINVEERGDDVSYLCLLFGYIALQSQVWYWAFIWRWHKTGFCKTCRLSNLLWK